MSARYNRGLCFSYVGHQKILEITVLMLYANHNWNFLILLQLKMYHLYHYWLMWINTLNIYCENLTSGWIVAHLPHLTYKLIWANSSVRCKEGEAAIWFDWQCWPSPTKLHIPKGKHESAVAVMCSWTLKKNLSNIRIRHIRKVASTRKVSM